MYGHSSGIDILIPMKIGEHTEQIRDIQNCIMTDEGRVRRELEALARRISRIEERLGITEPVVVPGD